MLIGLGLAALVIFGIRSLVYGKVKPLSIAVILIPFLLLVVLGFIFQGNATLSAEEAWATAAMWTIAIMLGICAVAVVFSGVRGLLGQ